MIKKHFYINGIKNIIFTIISIYKDINCLAININLNSLNSSNDECAFFTAYYQLSIID